MSGFPPGLGGGAQGEPPTGAPPPQPNTAAVHDISGTIQAQVTRLIEQARKDTEAKVKQELRTIMEPMMTIDKRLDDLNAQMDQIESQSKPKEPPLDAEAVGQWLSKIEQQWGLEIRTLKQELHQTILAHNHNADLIKNHKDTMDALSERCSKIQNGGGKTAEIQAQLQKLDARLKQQQKQRKLEPLFERISALEQKMTSVGQGAAWHSRYASLQAGMAPPGIGYPPGMMPGLGVDDNGLDL